MRKEKENRRRHSRKGRRILLLSLSGCLLLAAALFWILFYISEVEVVGNTRYTAQEVEDMVEDGFLSHNSVLLSVFRSHIDLRDILFMQSVDVEYLTRNKVRLHVSEKEPVGYVSLEETDYYFDKDGLVLEIIAAGEDQKANQVPQVTGLSLSPAAVGETLTIEDPSVFQTILALSKIAKKYEIVPDRVEFSENLSMTLSYDQVRIGLGDDSLLEEKMTRVTAILPKLSGLSGILHLEDFTEDTQNIIFDSD